MPRRHVGQVGSIRRHLATTHQCFIFLAISMSDADGWLAVADLKLNQQVGKPDPKNATLGEVLDHWLAYGYLFSGQEG